MMRSRKFPLIPNISNGIARAWGEVRFPPHSSTNNFSKNVCNYCWQLIAFLAQIATATAGLRAREKNINCKCL